MYWTCENTSSGKYLDYFLCWFVKWKHKRISRRDNESVWWYLLVIKGAVLVFLIHRVQGEVLLVSNWRGRGREVEKWRWGSLSTPLLSDRYIGWWSSARHQAVYWNQGWVFIISLVFMLSIQFQPLNEALGHLTPWCLFLVDEWLLVPNCHTHLYILPKQPRNFHLWIKEAAKIWTWEMFQILNCATLPLDHGSTVKSL